MNDATGRELRKGQVVDIAMSGMYHAKVMDVKESTLAGPTGESAAGCGVLLQIIIPVRTDPGAPVPMYIIVDAQEQDSDQTAAVTANKSVH